MFDFLSKGATDDAANGLRVRQIGALVLIGALILFSQILLQWSLASQQHDVHVIAVAARQATLCQEMVTAGYRLTGVGSIEARRSAPEELQQALAQLQRAHTGLQHGSDELGLPGANSIEIVKLFDTIESDYQYIVAAATTAAATTDRMGEFHQAVQRLGEHEPAFRSGMNAIVTEYENEARQRVNRTRWLGAGFGLLMLAALVLVARRIFEPAMLRLRRDMQRHEQHATEMQSLFSTSPSALLQVDAKSLAIVRGNGKARILLGCSIDDFLGRPMSTFFDTRLEINKMFLQKMRSGEVIDEHEVLLIDAGHHAIEALASLRKFPDSSPPSYLIGITDIGKARRG